MNIEELITKYLTNESTSEENAALLEWVISNEENKKEFAIFCQIWHDATKVNSKIDTEKAYNVFIKNTQKLKSKTTQTKVISLWKKMSAVAAVAIITIGVFFLFNQQNNVEMLTFENTSSKVQSITLSDGSILFLQKGAKVKYPEKFDSDKRNITIDGDVFCKIFRNEQAPFSISSNIMNVEVLGTSFEINTLQNSAKVIVESGKVKVSDSKTNKNVILEKGERADFNALELVKSINTDVNYMSWKTGELIFNNTKLSKVFSDIQRHYNCTFVVENASILNESLTGTFKNFTQEQIIDMITSTFPHIAFVSDKNNAIRVFYTK